MARAGVAPPQLDGVDQHPPPRAERFLLLGDQPAIEGADRLGFRTSARQLAELVRAARSSTPFTVGVQGTWGAGKSTLMALLRDELRAGAPAADGGPPLRISTVEFNAWTAGQGSVLEGLIKSVLDQLDPNILRRAARNRHLLSWARALASLVAHWMGLSRLVDQLWDKVEIDPRSRNDLTGLIGEAMEAWTGTNAGVGAGRLMVVFVDDLDRCSAQNVMEVFEALKLYLDAPGFVFVVGFDARIIGDAIAEERRYSDPTVPERYLEKIVQVHHLIARPSEAEAHALMDDLCEQAQVPHAVLDGAARRLIVERCGRNPRRMKRFLNRFILEYQLGGHGREDAQLLIQLLILQEHHDFFVLFEDDDADPIVEFTAYLAERDRIREEEPTPEARRARLDNVEYDLPSAYPELARNDDFVAFVRRIGDDERPRLLDLARRTRERESSPESFGPTMKTAPAPPPYASVPPPMQPPPAAPSATPPAPSAYPPPPMSSSPPEHAPPLTGTSVLWIDDAPERNRGVAEALERNGVRVVVARDGEDALRQLRVARPDAVITDITRGGDREAGLEDAARLRYAGYGGPLLFFAARITEARSARAAELGAVVENRPDEVVRFVEGAARTRWAGRAS